MPVPHDAAARPGGRIDRCRSAAASPSTAEPVTGLRGDTLASALLANGVAQVAPSIYCGRPRGIIAAGVEEPNALVQVDGRLPGADAHAPRRSTLSTAWRRAASPVRAGWPRRPTRHVYDAMHCTLRRPGRRRRTGRPGGGARRRTHRRRRRAGRRPARTGRLAAAGRLRVGRRRSPRSTGWRPCVRLQRHHRVRLSTTTASLLAVERRTGAPRPRSADGGVSRQRLWRIRARRVVLATGAHERPIVFAGNDRPGVMLAAAARSYLHRYGVLAGAGSWCSPPTTAPTPPRPTWSPPGSRSWRSSTPAPRSADVPPSAPRRDRVVTGRRGRPSTTTDRTSRHDRVGDAAPTARSQVLDCDLLAVSGGWNPAVHLYSQAGGRLASTTTRGLRARRPGRAARWPARPRALRPRRLRRRRRRRGDAA